MLLLWLFVFFNAAKPKVAICNRGHITPLSLLTSIYCKFVGFSIYRSLITHILLWYTLYVSARLIVCGGFLQTSLQHCRLSKFLCLLFVESTNELWTHTEITGHTTYFPIDLYYILHRREKYVLLFSFDALPSETIETDKYQIVYLVYMGDFNVRIQLKQIVGRWYRVFSV